MSNQSTATRPPLLKPASQNGWLLVLLFLFAIGYWLFARYLERIDLTLIDPAWWTLLFNRPMPPQLTFVRELFHWRVLRHLLPPIVGWWLAYQAAVGLVQTLYDLPDRAAGQRFLRRLISSPGSPLTALKLNAERLRTDRQSHVVLRIGGPGYVRIENGYVGVTEKNGRFFRTLDHGLWRLERFEFIHSVLDLRPQERTATRIEMVSQDGIPLTANLTVYFRVNPGDQPASRAQPFPFAETAVRAAAYAQTVGNDGTVAYWDSLPLNITRGLLTLIISKHPVDHILTPPTRSSQNRSAPLLSIKNELTYAAREKLQPYGIQLDSVHVSQIELPHSVTDQYVRYWQSRSEAGIRLSLAEGEAVALEELEMAQAEAEMVMIEAIVEGVQRARELHQQTDLRSVVALRLVETLEKMAQQSQQTTAVSPDLITQIDTWRHQLNKALPPGSQTPPTNNAD